MLKVCLLQMQTSQNLQHNLKQLEKYSQQLTISPDAQQLIVLPECALLFAYNKQQQFECADGPDLYPLRDRLSLLAKQKNSYLVAGSICVHCDNGKLYNRSYCFGPDGQILGYYDKLHLFDADVNDGHGYQESHLFQAGEHLTVIDAPIGQLGLTICYDLRFPELYQKLAELGAQILIVPAAFTENTGKSHWLPLLQARAIENQCFVIAVGQWGEHDNGRSTYGHSVVINGWGEVEACKPAGTGWLQAEIDLQSLASIRQAMPVVSHRRIIGGKLEKL